MGKPEQAVTHGRHASSTSGTHRLPAALDNMVAPDHKVSIHRWLSKIGTMLWLVSPRQRVDFFSQRVSSAFIVKKSTLARPRRPATAWQARIASRCSSA